MKILINTACLRFGGAVQGAVSLINELKNFGDNEYHVIVGRGVQKSLIRKEFPGNFVFYNFDVGPISLIKIPFISGRLSEYEKMIMPDCVVTSSGPSYWHSKSPHLMGYNLGLYIYNESPFMHLMSPYRKFRWHIKRKIHFWYFKRDATAYFVQTDDVNQRIRKVFDCENVYTISNTCNSFFKSNILLTKRLPPKKEQEFRFLTITAYYRHKNLEIIPQIIDELKKRGLASIKFILTIDNLNCERLFKKYKEDVITVGYIKPEECPSLYDECDFMFLPTLAECFSAAYPEAMIMKKPILTTDLSFAHDICDNAALYYEPLNPIHAADLIEKLINDEGLQEELKRNGLVRLTRFNDARERAAKILSLCQMLVNESKD